MLNDRLDWIPGGNKDFWHDEMKVLHLALARRYRCGVFAGFFA
jgi:hypothetical protein